ncbi:TPA: hypothetical protein ACYZ6U_000302 [Escherichia coli]|uniref:hypothetical protein n=1 Tax=Escherichia coli TaxID=562 RepID=UPI000BB8E931|nr:hypothetical protein [Escherichia coli]EFE8088340.1 hypothetical protein [Escherichia coli]EFO0495837.1 hypothetical protein [Escherichia coli]EGO4718615.1 hypothetical protein [Escherichia coli]EHP6582789.1 hypothetical protein [Escherichia coli]EKM4516333.1 hypothetical protein [Escherichia coli]
MKKYLYLKCDDFADTWVNGGVVPLFQASTYKNEDRIGVLTPDENQIDNSSHDLNSFGENVIFGKNARGYIGSITGPGISIKNVWMDRRTEDGLILCLSNRRSNFIAKKLFKFACVEINDVNKLKDILDEQIGKIGTMGPCSYTSSHHRNHFLKSKLDSWQDEYRIFWKDTENIKVEIPPGIAKRIPIRGRPSIPLFF